MTDESDVNLVGVTQPYVIPQEAIDRWLNIPEDTQIGLVLKRKDIDNVYFSIQKLVISLALFRRAISAESAEESDLKLNFIKQSENFSQESINHIAYFIESAMKTAVTVEVENG